MPRLRDPQGHKLEVTQEVFNKGGAVCDRCGWVAPPQVALEPEEEEDEEDEDSRS